HFFATSPASENSPCGTSVSKLMQVPAGYKPFALYHTHPYYVDSNAENFSAIPGDKFVAAQHNLFMYIMTPSHAVKWYIPSGLTSSPASYPAGLEYVLQAGYGVPSTYSRYLPASCY
ncbi:MAG: hypothetical protein M3Q07_24725, partial [Pseudobdellovibrionaceae bacterium]|nr:hypothetical protein [Pseudobdellovibrionaceae bacterium]